MVLSEISTVAMVAGLPSYMTQEAMGKGESVWWLEDGTDVDVGWVGRGAMVFICGRSLCVV